MLIVLLTVLLLEWGASVDAVLEDIVVRVRDHEDNEGSDVRGQQRISSLS
jgi:hypothetical protein